MSGAGDNLTLIETVAPADAAAVAEAVRSAGGQGRAVYPVGGGTQADQAAKPVRLGVEISLRGLNRVLDHAADDMTITVEAGVTMAALSERLAAKQQRLPVDVAKPERTTVGGAVAMNASGPRRFAYGTMRDYVLGFTAVDGTGTPFSGGGRVVKNAAGYNMARLMTGSLGTLGILTQVTLMVRPLPEASALLICDVRSLDMAEWLLADLVRSATRPVAVELLAGRHLDDHDRLGPAAAGRAGRLCVGFEGPSAEVQWMADQLRSEWAATGVAASTHMFTPYSEEPWRQLTEFPADLAWEFEINVLPSVTVAQIGEVLKIVPQSAVQAHAGNGVIHARVKAADGDNGACRSVTVDVICRLRDAATAAGGSMVVRKCADGIELTSADVWGPPGPTASVMQALKDRFDPQNVLNPGRFVFA